MEGKGREVFARAPRLRRFHRWWTVLSQSARTLRSSAVRSRWNDPLPRSEWSVNPFGTRGDAFRSRGLSRWDKASRSRAVGSRRVVLIRCPPSFGGLPSASSGAVPVMFYTRSATVEH